MPGAAALRQARGLAEGPARRSETKEHKSCRGVFSGLGFRDCTEEMCCSWVVMQRNLNKDLIPHLYAVPPEITRDPELVRAA